MMTGKIFENDGSQVVMLPEECRFDSDEIVVYKIGDTVLLMPKGAKWDSFLRGLDMFSDDFMEEGRRS